MNRTFMCLSAALGIAGVVYLTGLSHAQPPAGGAPAPGGAPAAPATRPTVAVFNMAGVMRDFGQAKYQVHLLNQRKNEMSKALLALRAEYLGHQKDLQINANHPEKDAKQQRMLALTRSIEDEDRKINKMLNDDASKIISDLYDRIKTVVDKTAEMNGYHVVFAYPDAVTPEEQNSAYIKELKLKPPAAQPFYVAPHADITGVVVKTLNAWYPPVDGQGKPVDVSKLTVDPAAPAPTTGGAPPVGGAPAGPGGGVPVPGKP
ncbi:outer membrane chaperone skp : : OmpH [Gemmata massiliana]|uniref:Outer membrane chaperone skp:: OmpH n=1 Tax=Gemmata massiliana TaxID=1210884 RepID=A0A6P2D7G3_9BACT|nr:OmpH family outer membrane protein [Gemmata massiliana]VTR96877.1 outer membrane chaperone skp : : OmpH [Gemmata massiliana]